MTDAELQSEFSALAEAIRKVQTLALDIRDQELRSREIACAAEQRAIDAEKRAEANAERIKCLEEQFLPPTKPENEKPGE